MIQDYRFADVSLDSLQQASGAGLTQVSVGADGFVPRPGLPVARAKPCTVAQPVDDLAAMRTLMKMNKDQTKGAGQNVKGRVEEAAGVLSGKKKLEAEGLADRVAGAAKYVVGAAKNGIAKKLDR